MGYRWVILGIVYLTMFAYAVVFQSIPPIAGLLITDLGLSHAQVGLLVSLFALPGIFLAIPAGQLSDRYGVRGLIIACLICMTIGTGIVAIGRAVSILAAGRLIAGAGGALLFVMGPKLVAEWFEGHELGTAAGFYSTAFPIGTVVALNTLGLAGLRLGWPWTILIGGAISIVALIAFVALDRPLPHRAQPSANSAGPRSAFQLGWPIWLVGGIWMIFNAAVIGFLAFAPDYFVSRGFGVVLAGFLSSVVMIFSPLLAPIVGYVLDRFGHAVWLLGLGGILTTLGILAIPISNLPPLVLLVPIGVGGALIAPTVYALPSEILPPARVGAGFGIVTTGLNLGATAGPYTVGLARDRSGAYVYSFYLMTFYALLIIVLAWLLARSRRDLADPGRRDL